MTEETRVRLTNEERGGVVQPAHRRSCTRLGYAHEPPENSFVPLPLASILSHLVNVGTLRRDRAHFKRSPITLSLSLLSPFIIVGSSARASFSSVYYIYIDIYTCIHLYTCEFL